tara:strand:- start:176 stop:325 length:150 start_codon:yes stop_codon:yes gene_type:complete
MFKRGIKMNLIEMLKDLAADDLDIVQGEDFVAISFKNRKEESAEDEEEL